MCACRLGEINAEPSAYFLPEQDFLRPLYRAVTRVLFHPTQCNLVADRMLPPNLHVELTARSRRIAVPKSRAEVMHRLRNRLVQGIGIDLHLVPDPVDIYVTDAAKCHTSRLTIRLVFASAFLRAVRGVNRFPHFRRFHSSDYRYTFRYIQVNK
jgi:hypothetical protein